MDVVRILKYQSFVELYVRLEMTIYLEVLLQSYPHPSIY